MVLATVVALTACTTARAQGVVISGCVNGADSYTGRPCGSALTPAQRAAQLAQEEQNRREYAARQLAHQQMVDKQLAVMGPGRRAEAERFVAMREAARLAKAKTAATTPNPADFTPIGPASQYSCSPVNGRVPDRCRSKGAARVSAQ